MAGAEFGFEICCGGKGLRVKNFTDRMVTR
jgi:hypothetical protein